MIPVLLTQPRSFTLQPFRRAWLLETLAVQPGRSRLPSLPLAFSWFKFAAFHHLGPSTNQRAPVKLFLRSHAHLESSLAQNQNPPYRCTAYQTFPPFWSSRPMATSGKLDLRSPSTNWKEAKKFLKELDTKKRREHYGIKDYITLKDIPSWKDHAKKLKVQQPEEVKYPKNKDLNQNISITKGDITKLEVDAIVNAANKSLLGGGGVDGCIHDAAGPLLKLECSTLNGCDTGEAKITCGYLLPAKSVIHAVGPVARGDPQPSDQEELKKCYKNSLRLAEENKLRSVAFPCIATGIYGYPSEDAADVALNTIRNCLEESPDKFDRVIICVFLKKDEDIYLQKFPEYFPLA
ncbi:ADP-ribose glycohydrolase MACROD1 isoform X2 [Pelobates fuscus]|uniref:ADP-ribose glycohydrolase MACROD1 isoform X2 n=1 Tax=Pelobates fuscus TaxID=191477 RepID=UPI002FE47EA8